MFRRLSNTPAFLTLLIWIIHLPLLSLSTPACIDHLLVVVVVVVVVILLFPTQNTHTHTHNPAHFPFCTCFPPTHDTLIMSVQYIPAFYFVLQLPSQTACMQPEGSSPPCVHHVLPMQWFPLCYDLEIEI
ncbi:hypothetical protein BO86DRAFT_5387 [Aspergillus japonicus CBS 114.51]|uniref:Uncharacterized protein n=1 Tax=Aspergillus japonicus CBS 114.51 TaxID=1448312 RepID=A0A8T8XHM7_ASPJA|nr:hypothetical protein BO86DRAFT_5387 [Aspergillus japonicus CBS 114.51]RAH87541.1 hypothetical protein BO86DRAFT_5387 [Aspergillus japonicus CBS 114.51]